MKRWEVTAIVRRDEIRRYILHCDIEPDLLDFPNAQYDLLRIEEDIEEVEIIEAPLEDRFEDE